VFERTSTGARLRAAVDNRGMAQAMGMNVPVLFSATFALGCGLAALGGILAAPMLPIEPMWPMKYLVLVLVIVALAGHGQVTASVAVAVIVGIVETAGRYLFPQFGGFFIYLLLITLMIWRPDGLLARRRTV
jgi:branched-chain amino acid transport system permease protein